MYRLKTESSSWARRTRGMLLGAGIVAAGALAASAAPGATPAATPGGATASAQAATVFYDAQVFTAEPDHPYADAVAVRGNRIIAVGDLAAVEKAAGAGARKVDLKGKFLMPGMIDGHAHPIDGGVTLIQANYPDTHDSIPALTQFVAEHVKKKDSRLGDVLVVNGIDIGYWAHAADIDAALSKGAFADQPIVLYGSDGHTAWANKGARTRAGSPRNTSEVCRQASGIASGSILPRTIRTDSWSTRARSSSTGAFLHPPPRPCSGRARPRSIT
jgi:predicted amidohydrolase YtcJ